MLALLAIAFGKDMATATVISLEPFLEATQPSLNKQATRASSAAAARPPTPSPPPATTTTATGTVPKNDPPRAAEAEAVVHRKSVDSSRDHQPTGLAFEKNQAQRPLQISTYGIIHCHEVLRVPMTHLAKTVYPRIRFGNIDFSTTDGMGFPNHHTAVGSDCAAGVGGTFPPAPFA